jgi:hypothetical protein
VGAYRLGETASILRAQGMTGLYTHSLFKFDTAFEAYAKDAIELGRSFVQPRYWGSRALDYLWQGLGAYLRHHPQIRYMFGPVSISARYPRAARDLMVHFYRHYFGCRRYLGEAKIPYKLSQSSQAECRDLFSGEDFEQDQQELKHRLSLYDLTIPTLFKHYTDLCEPGGACFLDFGVDPDFANCTDGMILVDVQRVKAAKRKRYIGESPALV